MIKRIILSLFMLGFTTSFAFAATYEIDPTHSSVTFKVKHLFSKVQGEFTEFKGEFDYVEGDPDQWGASATIQISSIDTNHEKRDIHLRSPDFFDENQFPTIEFESVKIRDVVENQAKLHGILTMHGVEQAVVLDLEIHGVGEDAWGKNLIGLTASTVLNRKDFGITWNKTLDSGSLLLGEEVEIIIEIEGKSV